MPPKKKTTASRVAPAPIPKGAPTLNRAGILAQTKALIKKGTGLEPLSADYSTHPHVPSGSTIVDHLIGGQLAADGKGPICPGFPRRRIIEVYGPESSGKTTFALASIVRIQKMGGVAMFLDFEHALHFGYAKTIGVDFSEDKLLFFQPDTLEEGLKAIFIAMRTGVDLVVVDSVAAMVPKAEMDKNLSDTAKVGAVAKAMAETLPKLVIWLTKPVDKLPGFEGTSVVFLNQTRALINTGGGGHGDNENTAGGKALKFYAYLRLRLQRIRSDYIERKDPLTGKKKRFPYSNVTAVKVVKNKVSGTQGYSGEIYIRYGYGLDDYMSLIEAAVARKILKRSGAYYEYEGERVQGKEAMRRFLLENPKHTAKLQDAVRDSILADAMPMDLEEEEGDKILSDLQAELDDDIVDTEGEEVYVEGSEP
jgi:recombination protein RecA